MSRLDGVTFTSYATPYDSFRGQRDIGSLHPDEADRLIRETFLKDGDNRGLAMEWNVRKDQVEGLWNLVVSVGLKLERRGLIRDFQERDARDVELIVAALDGTQLWLRVEEAFPPFDHLSSRTPYDWAELVELWDGVDYMDRSITELIEDGELATAENIHRGIYDRLSFRELRAPANVGKWGLVVDRVMAYKVATRVKTGVLGWSFLICPLIFVASIPVMIWLNLWVGLAMIAAGIVILKWSAIDLRRRIFNLARNDRDEYRWFVSRRVVWATRRS